MFLRAFLFAPLFLTAPLVAQSDPLLERSTLSTFELLISQEMIEERLCEIAAMVDATYAGEEVKLVSLMKGAICVTADLMRHLNTPSTLECIQTSSYGAGGKVRGELTIRGLENVDLSGKHVLVIDDIYDSGVTLETVVNKIKEKNPQSVRSFVLLMKQIPHKAHYQPEFIGFEIEDRFVIGYGMDYKEFWRDLPAVYAVD